MDSFFAAVGALLAPTASQAARQRLNAMETAFLQAAKDLLSEARRLQAYMSTESLEVRRSMVYLYRTGREDLLPTLHAHCALRMRSLRLAVIRAAAIVSVVERQHQRAVEIHTRIRNSPSPDTDADLLRDADAVCSRSVEQVVNDAKSVPFLRWLARLVVRLQREAQAIERGSAAFAEAAGLLRARPSGSLGALSDALMETVTSRRGRYQSAVKSALTHLATVFDRNKRIGTLLQKQHPHEAAAGVDAASGVPPAASSSALPVKPIGDASPSRPRHGSVSALEAVALALEAGDSAASSTVGVLAGTSADSASDADADAPPSMDTPLERAAFVPAAGAAAALSPVASKTPSAPLAAPTIVPALPTRLADVAHAAAESIPLALRSSGEQLMACVGFSLERLLGPPIVKAASGPGAAAASGSGAASSAAASGAGAAASGAGPATAAGTAAGFASPAGGKGLVRSNSVPTDVDPASLPVLLSLFVFGQPLELHAASAYMEAVARASNDGGAALHDDLVALRSELRALLDAWTGFSDAIGVLQRMMLDQRHEEGALLQEICQSLLLLPPTIDDGSGGALPVMGAGAPGAAAAAAGVPPKQSVVYGHNLAMFLTCDPGLEFTLAFCDLYRAGER